LSSKEGLFLVDPEKTDSTAEFEQSVNEAKKQSYVLRLYVAGMTPRSINAIDNIKKICEEELTGRYELQVIDVYQQPDAARTEQIIAAPTLIKKLPLPLRKIIGDMSDKERVILGLNIVPKK
jgi:circadian clock protein KaiB